ncbi:MAG: hypothetical protein JSU76_03490, partial [Dehalococcoidia bacterium]
MSSENNKKPPKFPTRNRNKKQSRPNEGLNTEFHPHEGYHLAIPLEQLGEQEVVDDPVRIYLHEIGRVPLLTAKEEQTLSRKIAEAKRVTEIKQNLQQIYGREPSASETVLAMLREVGQASFIIHLILEQLNLTPAASFKEALPNAKLRASIDGEISQQLIQSIAQKTGKSITDTEHLLVNLSLNSNLLPKEALDAIRGKVSLTDTDNLVTDS